MDDLTREMLGGDALQTYIPVRRRMGTVPFNGVSIPVRRGSAESDMKTVKDEVSARLESEKGAHSSRSQVARPRLALGCEYANVDGMMSDLTIGEPKKRASLTKFFGNFGKTFNTAAKNLTDKVRDKFNRTKEEDQDNENDNQEQEEPQNAR